MPVGVRARGLGVFAGEAMPRERHGRSGRVALEAQGDVDSWCVGRGCRTGVPPRWTTCFQQCGGPSTQPLRSLRAAEQCGGRVRG